MPFLRLILTNDDLASIRAAALARRLSVAAWARSELVSLASKAAPPTASNVRKVDVRTAEHYATVKANTAENGMTVADWAERRLRQNLTRAERADTERMLAMYEAEQEG